MTIDQALLRDVGEYYSSKLAEHGETPRGVDWNGEASQVLRFEKLCGVIDGSPFSLNDLGCGYGALFGYLSSRFHDVTYRGYDVSADMIEAAKCRYGNDPRARFTFSSEPQIRSDYGIASGIFNVRLNHANAEWRNYLEATLDVLNGTSTKGFAFNCLTSYSDKEKMKMHLYYANPAELFDLCKQRYSRQVALLHDYGLYEFTIIVRKPQ